MPRGLAIAAALATVLAVAACGSAQPGGTDGAGASDAAPGGAETTEMSTRSTETTMLLDPGEPGLPAGSGASVDDVLRLGAVATWTDAPDTFAVSLPATADCWPTAAPPTVTGEASVAVVFTFVDAPGCKEPDAARTFTVDVPAEVDASGGLEVSVDGLEHRFTLTLPAP